MNEGPELVAVGLPPVTIVDEKPRDLPPGVGFVDLGAGIPVEPGKVGTEIPTLRVSPLDKNAHLRRTVEDLYADQQRVEEALRVHQRVLQKQAELHSVQANAREELRRALEQRIASHHKVALDVSADRTEPLRRGFLGRLRWLFRGE